MTPPPPNNFSQMAAAAILFLMDSSQKLIRSSEIPRKQPKKTENIWEELPCHLTSSIYVKKIKILVKAKLRIHLRRWKWRRRNNVKYYKHPDIHRGCLNNA